MRTLLLTLFLLLNFPTLHAGETLVLIHGYHSDSHIWRETGITHTLHRAGWQDGGDLFPWGAPKLFPSNPRERYFYTVNLPSEAPLSLQAQWLDFYLHLLQDRHPENSFVLIGHSAGGVIARLTMVVSHPPVKGLITIASPHLGTDSAEEGLALTHSPIGWFAPWLGLESLNRSEGLYYDLVREYPRTPLFWLNRQAHPKAFYVSILRARGDQWVPPYSQDLNDVPALQGQATTLVTVASHALHPEDGLTLVSILKKELDKD